MIELLILVEVIVTGRSADLLSASANARAGHQPGRQGGLMFWSAVASAARHRFGLFATSAGVWSSAFRRLLLLKTSPPKSGTSKPKRRRRCALPAHSRYCSHRRANQNHPGVPILLRQNVLARGNKAPTKRLCRPDSSIRAWHHRCTAASRFMKSLTPE